MDAKIKKIVIEVGNRQIELTEEEARKMNEVLSEMFGSKQLGYPVFVDRIRYTEPSWPTLPPYPTMICSGATSGYVGIASGQN